MSTLTLSKARELIRTFLAKVQSEAQRLYYKLYGIKFYDLDLPHTSIPGHVVFGLLVEEMRRCTAPNTQLRPYFYEFPPRPDGLHFIHIEIGITRDRIIKNAKVPPNKHQILTMGDEDKILDEKMQALEEMVLADMRPGYESMVTRMICYMPHQCKKDISWCLKRMDSRHMATKPIVGEIHKCTQCSEFASYSHLLEIQITKDAKINCEHLNFVKHI